MKSDLTKVRLFSTIRFMSISMLPIAPTINIDTLSLDHNQGRLLVVSYTERGDAIRLISAREVTRTEREAYEKG